MPGFHCHTPNCACCWPDLVRLVLRHGHPPLSVEAMLSSANFTLSLLPVRLAHRIQALRNLPFIVVSNPHISAIYGNYLHSLSTLLPYTERRITTLQDESNFTEVLADLVQTHANTIPVLARGFAQSKSYIAPVEVTRFLDEHLRARIGTRLMAEQHIALHFESLQRPSPPLNNSPRNTCYPTPPSSSSSSSSSSSATTRENSYVGVIDTMLRPATVIECCASFVSDICELRYGVRPSIVVDGQPDTTFAFVPVHLEYIVTELLKNAFRAVVESGNVEHPVVVTIAASPPDESSTSSTSPLSSEVPPASSSPCSTTPPLSPSSSPPSSSSSPSSHPSRVSSGPPTDGLASSSSAPIKNELPSSAPGVTIRIRDRGGGIAPEHLNKVWSYSFTTFSEEDPSLYGGGSSSGGIDSNSPGSGSGSGGTSTPVSPLHLPGSPMSSSIAGLGYGLPLSRAYAEYFGGRIALQSMFGWGTDVYLSLKGVQ